MRLRQTSRGSASTTSILAAECMAESHVPSTRVSAWLDLPLSVFPAFGPEPAATNSQAISTSSPTSRALITLTAILVQPCA
jgi:hypothetical protein